MLLPRFALTLFTVLALFLVPGAAAAHRAKTTSAVTAAAAVGAAFWGSVPCNGQVTYRTRRAVPAVLDAERVAWATFDTPLGANNLAADASGYSECTISFARVRWPTAASLWEDWDMFCLMMVHELGHLHGRAHDLTVGSVMLPLFTDYSSEPSLCRAARPSRGRA